MKLDILKLTLKNQFPTELVYPIPLFRAACSTINSDPIIHHHIDDTNLLVKYPIVQFKLNIAAKPTIIAFNEGVEAVLKIIGSSVKQIYLNKILYNIEIDSLQIKPFNCQLWKTSFTYSIENWIALNQENYEKFNILISLTDKILFLEKLLIAHILTFAQRINYLLEETLELKITYLKSQFLTNYKNTLLTCFNLQFYTNISLPPYIGLGRATAVGFGVVKPIHKLNNSKNNIDETNN